MKDDEALGTKEWEQLILNEILTGVDAAGIQELEGVVQLLLDDCSVGFVKCLTTGFIIPRVFPIKCISCVISVIV